MLHSKTKQFSAHWVGAEESTEGTEIPKVRKVLRVTSTKLNKHTEYWKQKYQSIKWTNFSYFLKNGMEELWFKKGKKDLFREQNIRTNNNISWFQTTTLAMKNLLLSRPTKQAVHQNIAYTILKVCALVIQSNFPVHRVQNNINLLVKNLHETLCYYLT